MALVTLLGDQVPVEIVAAGGRGIAYAVDGTAFIENAADPSAGIPLKAGDTTLVLDGWTAAWTAASATAGKTVLLHVAAEAGV